MIFGAKLYIFYHIQKKVSNPWTLLSNAWTVSFLFGYNVVILQPVRHNKCLFYIMAKQKSLEQSQRQELARMYFMQGLTQKDIADKVGVSRNTICSWIKDGKWDTLRAANTVSRKELVTKMLQQIDDKLQSGQWTADEICKAANAVEKLDKQTNIITIIEVFAAFNKWLVSRMQVDSELTPELVKVINKYQDTFIGEKLGNTSVSSLE